MTRPVPIMPEGFGPLRAYLQELDARTAELENPQGPHPVYACAKAKLPTASKYINCVIRVTDSNILVHSDGTNWISEKTGSAV